MKMCNMYLDIIKYCVGLFNECINRKGNLKEVFHKEKGKRYSLNSCTYTPC